MSITLCIDCKHYKPSEVWPTDPSYARCRATTEVKANYVTGNHDHEHPFCTSVNKSGNCSVYKEGDVTVVKNRRRVKIDIYEAGADAIIDLILQLTDDRSFEFDAYLKRELSCHEDNVGQEWQKLSTRERMNLLFGWMVEEC